MKALIKALALPLLFFSIFSLPGFLLSGPYPGSLPNHGHSASGDGGVIGSLSVTTKFGVGASSLTTAGLTASSVTVTTGFFTNISITTATFNEVTISSLTTRNKFLVTASSAGGSPVGTFGGVEINNPNNTIGSAAALELSLRTQRDWKWKISAEATQSGPSALDPKLSFGLDNAVGSYTEKAYFSPTKFYVPGLMVQQSTGTFVSLSSSTTNAAARNTSVAITITPQFSNSAFRVTMSGYVACTVGAVNVQLGRNGTGVGRAFTPTSCTVAALVATSTRTFTITEWDRPSTTSPVTYSVMFNANSGIGTAFFGLNQNAHIDVEEYAQ